MRKFISFLFSLIIALTPLFSLAADYTSLSDEELLSSLDQIRAELEKRTFNSDRIICDSEKDGIIMALHKDALSTDEFDGSRLYIKCIVVNNGDKQIGVQVDKVAINGWECETTFSYIEIDPSKKAIITVEVRDFTSLTDCSSIEDIEDMEFYCYTYNPNSGWKITDNLRKKVVLK